MRRWTLPRMCVALVCDSDVCWENSRRRGLKCITPKHPSDQLTNQIAVIDYTPCDDGWVYRCGSIGWYWLCRHWFTHSQYVLPLLSPLSSPFCVQLSFNLNNLDMFSQIFRGAQFARLPCVQSLNGQIAYVSLLFVFALAFGWVWRLTVRWSLLLFFFFFFRSGYYFRQWIFLIWIFW
jgi:hypothetical protein